MTRGIRMMVLEEQLLAIQNHPDVTAEDLGLAIDLLDNYYEFDSVTLHELAEIEELVERYDVGGEHYIIED